MRGTLPSWFHANEIFSSGGRWYIGSRRGLHIGPYQDRKTAKTKGARIAKRLQSLKNDHERLLFVRRVLHQEWDHVEPGCEMPARPKPVDSTPSAQAVRAGEDPKHWYRSDRFFSVDSVWFFSTREGIDVGPFDSEADAKRHERRLVSLLMRTKTPEQAYRLI